MLIEPHPVFRRKGADLFLEKTISLREALVGFNFEITQLDGHPLTIATLPGEVISNGLQQAKLTKYNESVGAIKCVKKKGLPFYKDPMGHGNLYVVFKVEFPKKGELKPAQIEELKKLLPGAVCPALDKSKPVAFLETFHEADTNPNPSGGKGMPRLGRELIMLAPDEESEEEGGMPRGAQRVQCQQQ